MTIWPVPLTLYFYKCISILFYLHGHSSGRFHVVHSPKRSSTAQQITNSRFYLGFSAVKLKSVIHVCNNCDLNLTLKKCSEAFVCWQVKDELCGLHAGVWTWAGPARPAAPLSQAWYPHIMRRGGGDDSSCRRARVDAHVCWPVTKSNTVKQRNLFMPASNKWRDVRCSIYNLLFCAFVCRYRT